MFKVVDRVRKALGLSVRISGAIYTQEYWSEVPPAPPQEQIHGVHVDLAGFDVRSARPTPPPLPVASVSPAATPQLRFPPVAGAMPNNLDEEWTEVIRQAKVRAAQGGRPEAEEDWDLAIARAKAGARPAKPVTSRPAKPGR